MVIRLESGPTGLDFNCTFGQTHLAAYRPLSCINLVPLRAKSSDSAHLMTPAAVPRPDVQTLQPAVELLFHTKKTT